MLYADIQAALHRRKFKPFMVVLNDGTKLVVERIEDLIFAGEETIVLVTYEENRTKHQIHIIDLDQINRVSLEPIAI